MRIVHGDGRVQHIARPEALRGYACRDLQTSPDGMYAGWVLLFLLVNGSAMQIAEGRYLQGWRFVDSPVHVLVEGAFEHGPSWYSSIRASTGAELERCDAPDLSSPAIRAHLGKR